MGQDPAELSAKVERLVRRGMLDDHLNDLIQVIVDRRKYVAQRQALEMVQKVEIGDEVQYHPNTRPQYLASQLGIVEGIDSKRRSGVPLLRVRLKRGPQGKFRTGIVLSPGSSVRIRRTRKQIEAAEQKALDFALARAGAVIATDLELGDAS